MNKKLSTLMAALLALAITTLACSAGGVSVGWTPTSTPVSAAVAPTLVVPPASGTVPTLAPTAGSGPAATVFAPFPTLAPAASLTPTAPAATMTAVPTGVPIAACMPGSRFTQLKNAAFAQYPNDLDARITMLIVAMDQEFNLNPALGYRSEVSGAEITNPGNMGVAWTDVGGSDIKLPIITSTAPGGLARNWVPLAGLNKTPAGRPDLGWGFKAVFTSLRMQTGFTLVRLCEVVVAW